MPTLYIVSDSPIEFYVEISTHSLREYLEGRIYALRAKVDSRPDETLKRYKHAYNCMVRKTLTFQSDNHDYVLQTVLIKTNSRLAKNNLSFIHNELLRRSLDTPRIIAVHSH